MRKQELMYQMFGKTEQQKCKDCKHLVGGTNEYRKCEIYGKTHSEATDWTLKSDACGLFNKDYDGDVPIVKLVSAETRKDIQIQGQMRLEL